MIRLEKVNKYFNKGKKNQIHVINNVSLDLENKGLIALLGPSGCGKTTLLNVIGGLDKIKKGKIYVNNEKISRRNVNKIDKIRNINIGYIFQDYKLIDSLSVFDNVAIVLKMIGIKDKKEIKKRVDYVLETLSIYRYRHRPASMLSGGERQRVAIARAIVKDPDIILADEPTGNLDSKNTIEIMNIIKSISKNRLVLLVTHESNLAKFYADRIIELEDGSIIKDYKNTNKDNLDYRIENNIYLKDLKYNEKLNNITIYSDKKTKVNITLAVVNNNIYIKNDDNYKIEIVDDTSSVKLINDHYKTLDLNEVNKYEFNFKEIINNNYKKKYSSIFNPITFITSGFKKIINYSFVKKVLLLGYMASSMFILLSVSRMFAVKSINDKDFITYNRNYIVVEKNKIKLEDYENLKNLESSKYLLLSDSKIKLEITYNTLIQNYEIYMDQISGSLTDISVISKKDLIAGRMPENDYEIVIDKMVADELFSMNGSAKSAGILKVEDLINVKAKIDRMKDFKIVGITNLDEPSIFVNKNLLFDMTYLTSKLDEKNYLNVNTTEFTLVKGNMPSNDYEVLVNEEYKDIYSLGSKLSTKINKNKLKVVGFYSGDLEIDEMITTENTIRIYMLTSQNDIKKVVVYSDEKNNTLNELTEKGFNAKDSYDYSKTKYLKSKNKSVKSSLIFAGVVLAISLIEIYLMIRSSFLSRIKEVGIYRAIGVKKRDICIMFLGEILAITSTASMAGITIMGYILYNISKMRLVGSMVIINIPVVLISIIIIYLFNITVGLIPVLNTIRKTPANILSRNDI